MIIRNKMSPLLLAVLFCFSFPILKIVLSVEGKTFTDIGMLRIYLAQFKWDEEARLRLLRNGEVKEVVLKFQFGPQTEDMPKKDEK